MKFSLTTSENTDKLQLCKIEVKEEYLKEWNEKSSDFHVLVKDGKLLHNTLYRKGGINFNLNVGVDKYFMLLKYFETEYTLEFLKKCHKNKSIKELEKHKKYLKSNWVILDENGVEKFENKSLHSPYLIKNSCIFSDDNKYYNIETMYYYGHCSGSRLESTDYIFLDNNYGGDKPLIDSYKTEHPAGIVKIHKLTGEFEVFNK